MIPEQRRASARYQARLDAETSAKLAALVRTFHRTRSAMLRHVMQWGLTQTQEWTVDRAVPATVHTLSMLLEPELLQHVQEVAAVHGATVAAWVREAVRRITDDDFPESWRAEATHIRSHDSQTYGQRFMLRLDETTTQKLQEFVDQFDRSRAEIIRQLVAQATLEDFPQSWQPTAAAHRPQDAAAADRGTP